MLTEAQVAAGALRLVDQKLSDKDVDKLTSSFRLALGSLETLYNYQFKTKLSELDDSSGSEQKAAQVAACIIEMESLGFGVASLTGNLNYKEKDQYLQFVIYAFSKIYPIPPELSSWDLRRKSKGAPASKTVLSTRYEEFDGAGWGSERDLRRAHRR